MIDSDILRTETSSESKSNLTEPSDSQTEQLLKENNYILKIKVLKDKKQLMKQLNVNWGWTWDTFANKIGLKKGANAQLWIKTSVVNNKNNYRKFVTTYKGQSSITVQYEQREIAEDNCTQ